MTSEPDHSELPPSFPPPLPAQTVASIAPRRGAWGFWSTAGWGALIGCAYVGVQIFVTVAYLFARAVRPHGQSIPSSAAVAANGLVLSLAAILTVPVVVGLCGLLVKLRNGPTLREYLGLVWPNARAVVGWCLGLGGLIVASDLLTIVLGRPLVPEVMADFYRTATFKPLIWVAVVLAAPLAEECFFRGFLFHGWRESRLGGVGTVGLTSACWAMIHVQYDAYGIATIFVSGLLIGLARLQTGSLLLCVGLHALMNLVATIEVARSLPAI